MLAAWVGVGMAVPADLPRVGVAEAELDVVVGQAGVELVESKCSNQAEYISSG
jgi:hypothetical protein